MSVPEDRSLPSEIAAILPFRVPQRICRDFQRASRLEWLETNHTGAFAMGTVAGVNTRRYHSLFVASLNPPSDRFSILPRVEETVTVNAQSFHLATVQYPAALHPRGFELLDSFELSPFPTWHYACGPARVTKMICLLDHQQSVLVRYTVTQPCRLDLRSFLAFRDYHSLTTENSSLRRSVDQRPGEIKIAPYPDLPPLTIFHSGEFRQSGIWYHNHEYLRELERGLDFREDLFSPGAFQFEMTPGAPAWFIATLEPERFPVQRDNSAIESLLAFEFERCHFARTTPLESTLARALDQFRVTRFDGGSSLIAGYPWFTDWSRDTLISLPALPAAGFPENEVKDTLETLLTHHSQGLLPNRFSDAHSQPEYNTADATLWFFIAADDFIRRTNDTAFLRDIVYPAAQDILEWHRRGTLYDIHTDPTDHLLSAGTPATQLTWMDAMVDGEPVMPRAGKPIEINALWYNALSITARWSQLLGFPQEAAQLNADARLVRSSFENAFWDPVHQRLFDVITPSGPDSSFRPNQLFALSLPFPLFDRAQARIIVAHISEKLLTPVGLRTLDPADPRYHPRFAGSAAERDRAYHQGAVWPWLLGPFIDAYLYAHDESPEAVAFCRAVIDRLTRELTADCLGSLSEVYDGDPPHQPSGCPAQLWSIARLILASKRLHLLQRPS